MASPRHKHATHQGQDKQQRASSPPVVDAAPGSGIADRDRTRPGRCDRADRRTTNDDRASFSSLASLDRIRCEGVNSMIYNAVQSHAPQHARPAHVLGLNGDALRHITTLQESSARLTDTHTRARSPLVRPSSPWAASCVLFERVARAAGAHFKPAVDTTRPPTPSASWRAAIETCSSEHLADEPFS